ncbi:MAG: biotin--[acetyl-CoA-carboxylase] ligase, partial [Oscillospiraceae bacterium]|nr:biotin--[acetyl-CoA-carboxylase] ligase [Oscillospiraceae bacterium]
GIGVNISDPDGGFDESIKDIAGSVFGSERPENARENIVASFLSAFEAYYLSPTNMRYTADYRARSLAVGKRITAIGASETFEAFVLGVDDNCGLIVRRDDGREQTLTTGEISIKLAKIPK